MSVAEKVAYLKGLMEGMKVEEKSDAGRIFAAIVDVLDSISEELEQMADEIVELGDGLDVVSDDLADVEEYVFDEFDDDDDDDDEDDDDETVYATTCPECEEQIFFDEDYLEDGKLECPNCGAKLEFDAVDFEEADGDE